jgi:hypothetical protein
MKFAAALLAMVALATPTASIAAGDPMADARAVKALILRENAAFNSGSWQALWNMYAPSFHKLCKYPRWAAAGKKLRAKVPSTSTTGIRVRVVSGERAVASYVLRAGSKVIARPKGDVYVKLGGRWLDSESDCGY